MTGGAGFIGSNLAVKLAEENAVVTVVDFLHPEYGGNLFNLDPVKERVTLRVQDLNDFEKTSDAVKNQDFVFHLASQQNHVLWQNNPFEDLQNNVRATLSLLRALQKTGFKGRLVYGGTRGEYGAQKGAIGESALPKPLGFHELSKLFAGNACELYSKTFGFEFVWARMANVYGPRAQVKANTSNVINWFVRLALEGKKIPLYQNGKIKRDLIYVDDCVDALMKIGLSPSAHGNVFNIGSGTPVSLLEVAEKITGIAVSGGIEFVEADAYRKKQEVGDVFLDIGKLEGLTGFKPKTSLGEGLRLTVDYYKKHLKKYV